ncbi:MAG: hypothetical protein JJT76_15205 [Clostridiaceae bacterium]|nr:hypothetical protein [Clostridiaceae bacterium]
MNLRFFVILSNLTIKFTEEGNITVEINKTQDGIVISVKDKALEFHRISWMLLLKGLELFVL